MCNVAYAAEGTPVGPQTDGDCDTYGCDGAGNVAHLYTPTDIDPGDANCIVDAYCTPSGPVHEPAPDGTPCPTTCGCPELNNGTCGPSPFPCTEGLCLAGACVDAIPVMCQVNPTTIYTRCDLTAGQHTIYWDVAAPECQAAGACDCTVSAYDVDYCAPGTVCYVNDENGWLGPQLGTGVCL